MSIKCLNAFDSTHKFFAINDKMIKSGQNTHQIYYTSHKCKLSTKNIPSSFEIIVSWF